MNYAKRIVEVTNEDLNNYVMDHFKCPIESAVKRSLGLKNGNVSVGPVAINICGLPYRMPGAATWLFNDLYVNPDMRRVKPITFEIGEML